jgi:hypothetical protein
VIGTSAAAGSPTGTAATSSSPPFTRHAPAITLTATAAGLHAIATLPPGHDEHHAVAVAAAADVAVEPLETRNRSG